MTDFKTTKRVLYSTPMDVRTALQAMEREVQNFDGEAKLRQDIPDALIEQHINRGDAIINMYLLPVYGAAAMTVSPYFSTPIAMRDNESDFELTGVVIASTALTEQWLIRFTAADVYTLIGTISGVQGASLAKGSDNASTNGDVTIKAEDWVSVESDSVAEKDQFTFSTYVSHPTVNAISTMLAAGSTIDSLYSDSESDESKWGKRLYEKAMQLLKDLSNENNPASLETDKSVETNVPDFIAASWIIDGKGRDQTSYLTISGDASPFQDSDS